MSETAAINSEVIIDWAITFGLQLLSAAVILFIGWWITKILTKGLFKILLRSKVDIGAAGFICSVIKVFLWIIALLTALSQLKINITSMIAALGAAGLTASFALQGSLGNFVSGMQVIFSKPFGVGDFLSVDTFMGTVKSISVLNTVLVTPDNKEIIIPNSRMTSDIVVNFTSSQQRRIDLVYNVSYDTDLSLPKEIIKKLVRENENIQNDPAPIIAVGEHGPSSIQIVAKIWVPSDLYWDIYYEMQERVKIEFDKAGVVIPFPQMDIHSV